MKKIGFFVMGILFSLAGLSQEQSSEQGLFLRSGDGELLPASSVGTAVEVRVTGIVARTRVTQIFTNPTRDTVEGVYVFPLPDGAAVDTLRMTVGRRVLEGVVRQKQEAAAEYKQAKEEGRRASLVDFERPGVFTTAVANLGPGETVEIALELQQVVEYGRGRFGLRFPLGSAAPTFAFHVDLAPGFPLGRIESSSHDITVTPDERRLRYAVDLAAGRSTRATPARADFALEWAPAVGREPRAVYFTEKIGDERYALLMVMPPEFHPDTADAAAARLPRETVYVIDTSGSMEGDSIEQARKALQLGLDRLAPGDAFDVIRFSGDAKALFGQGLPVDSGKVRNARDWVGGFKADGGTNMLAALQLALPQGQAGSLLRQVIFVTDGQVSGEAELLHFIDRHLGESRLFTVAIGSAPNAAFLRKAAARGRGTFTAIDSTGKVAAGMADLFARIETPLLRDVAVRWSDPDAEAWPERISDLYLGEPIVVTARLRGAAGPVEVEGLRGDEPWGDEIPAAAEVRGAGLDKLWAGQKVQTLLDSLAGGADPDEVEREVTELGLRYHLLTPYTSLVVVDPEAAPLPEPEPPSGDFVEEAITVTAESPLLDERRITTGATVSQVEMQNVPGARDPWAILQSTPGVLTDRIRVGGNESGQRPVATVGASSSDQTVWTYEICNFFGGPGPVPVSEFEAFEEMQVATGGSDVALETAGPQITLIGLRGTNEWRGSGSLAWTGGALAGNREERVEELRAGSAEGGGPLRRDSFWIWTGLASSEVDRIALGGGAEESARGSATLKLNAQLAVNNSMSILARAGDASGTGAGAAPYRAAETTWEQDGRESLWKIEDTHVVSADLFLLGHLAGNEGSLRNRPEAGTGADGRIDAAGVARGSWFGSDEEQRTREAELSASAFFDTGASSHEVRLGAQARSLDAERVLTPPGRLVLAGEALGLPAGTALAELWEGGRADAQLETRSLWAQDTASLGRATFNLGLRWDALDLGLSDVGRAHTLQPRLGLTYVPGAERKLALRASASRFTSWLGAEPVLSAHPAALRSSAFRFEDLDGDLVLDPGEPSAFAFRQGPLALSTDLEPEITDEAALEAEYSLRPEMLVSLQATWRRTSEVLEERWLVRDSSNGEVFTATAADWIRGGSVDGVGWYDLRPGLEWTGGRLLANGDRRRDTFDLALSWQKRLSNRWMSRGHVAWHDWTWQTGPESTRFDDPTPALGGGDLDGQRLLLPAGDSVLPHEPARFLGSRWSFHLMGGFNLPRDLFLSLAVDGREGVPLTGYRQVLRERAGLVRVPIAGKDFRTSDLITADLNLSKDIYLGDFAIIPSLDIFNLLDTSTVAERQLDLGTSRAGQPLRVLSPRTFRLGVRVTWR